jgi:hypothetical protein
MDEINQLVVVYVTTTHLLLSMMTAVSRRFMSTIVLRF